MKDRSIEDLSATEARDLFEQEFVTNYNKGKLSEMFYSENGLPADVRDQSMKTKHNWGIKLSAKDKEQVADVAYTVDNKTRVKTDGAWNHMSTKPHPSAVVTNTKDKQQSSSYKSLRADSQNILEEGNYTKGTGREAMMQKRQAAGERTHGSARAREDDRDGGVVNDNVLMGDDGESFESVKARMAKGGSR
eukprot:CAMPEP_0119047052 /NCGR_PEP_ID=MMETSP1177-20130426/50677_1 /TAXON_ID=2985 /ORGANISM="Ochromonas sp, Strain CCMP1899" /LENGTH=190 /DNA_ID=CAMNT_0007021061 /DNA_START=293 /DNA_END=862 /DNA_ORIENTATION=+